MTKILTGNVSRRLMLKTTAATALMGAIKTAFPSGAFAQGAGPETTKAILGFIALTDSAALIIAKEKGFFDKHGMTGVEVVKQASWGAMRDNLVLGSDGSGVDGVHILTPMPYFMETGKIIQGGQPLPMTILARLNLDAQAISVASTYKDLNVGLDSSPLREVFARKKAEGNAAKAAMTFPGGTHDMWIRYWLAAGGIDPDSDLETIVVPPPQMAANMKVGTMDVCCVGEPWPGQIVNQEIGYTAVNTSEIWQRHPEKSFAMRTDWVEANPRATKALVMAVQEAAQWCEDMANKDELASIIGKRAWLNAPTNDIIGRLKGVYDYGTGRVENESPHFMKFWSDHASYPYQSHEAWFLAENIRWGKFEPDTDINGLVAKVNREDIWREAAKDLGVTDVPESTSRGVETFFDGKTFDPENPSAYLESLAITRLA